MCAHGACTVRNDVTFTTLHERKKNLDIIVEVKKLEYTGKIRASKKQRC